MTNLAILNNSIRSYENLYSLNDLHKASGNAEKHRPSLFIRLDTTQDLISEIQKEVKSTDLILKTTGGRGLRGTYACEELVLSYAMWISSKFHLIVLRAFLNLHKNQTALLPSTITPEQQQAIQSAVQQAHHRTGLHWQEIYRQLKAMFHIAKYDQLPQDQFGNAMAFVMNLQPIALPSPKPKTYTIEMTENDITVLLWLWFIAVRVIGSLKMLVKPLKLLQAPIAPEVVSQAHEYPFTVEHARRILLKMSKDLEAEPWRDYNLSRVLPKIRNFNESDLAYPGDHRNT